MVSLIRTLRNIRRAGLAQWWRFTYYNGDAKFGQRVGTDQFGNKYFENLNPEEEIPGRHRWVDLAQHDYDATQVPPEWHAWLSHIRKEPLHLDPIVQAVNPPWKAPHVENMTGTRGAYRPYNTVRPKVNTWVPTTAPRGEPTTTSS
ncbi:NDUFA12-domain-containing protein [Cantharellus anzutake]|uniref:NDUFA12-domain-containing protein n=1 Tax=Cantharellus anzutake TaxID=1750568 RepID=UPI0019030AC4|nr:NDUFA12-domain-containing protein [Cantharellus anzutake]KAF8330827.1 NDUFA12-domain-containing protein [Cantharellus anzutake]